MNMENVETRKSKAVVKSNHEDNKQREEKGNLKGLETKGRTEVLKDNAQIETSKAKESTEKVEPQDSAERVEVNGRAENAVANKRAEYPEAKQGAEEVGKKQSTDNSEAEKDLVVESTENAEASKSTKQVEVITDPEKLENQVTSKNDDSEARNRKSSENEKGSKKKDCPELGTEESQSSTVALSKVVANTKKEVKPTNSDKNSGGTPSQMNREEEPLVFQELAESLNEVTILEKLLNRTGQVLDDITDDRNNIPELEKEKDEFMAWKTRTEKRGKLAAKRMIETLCRTKN